MNDVILVTPPDILYNKTKNLLLVNPNEDIKAAVSDVILQAKNHCNLYLYDHDDSIYIDWLLTVHKFADLAIIDLDNIPNDVRPLQSYFISHPYTYYYSKEENFIFSKISKNRIFDKQNIETIIGVLFE